MICPIVRVAAMVERVMNKEPNDRRPDQPPSETSVPKGVVRRLSLYQRELQRMMWEGEKTVSSTRLGQLLGFSDAQVRKDLAYFGQFGYPGIGYRCRELIVQIRKILGTNQDWPVAIIGAGNLGRALLGYKGFGSQGFRIVAAFDSDPKKWGQAIENLCIQPLSELEATIREQKIRLGVVTVPAEAAQQVADRLVDSGIEGILNFAPVTLKLPPTVDHVAVDLAIQLEQVCFAVVNRETAP